MLFWCLSFFLFIWSNSSGRFVIVEELKALKKETDNQLFYFFFYFLVKKGLSLMKIEECKKITGEKIVKKMRRHFFSNDWNKDKILNALKFRIICFRDKQSQNCTQFFSGWKNILLKHTILFCWQSLKHYVKKKYYTLHMHTI